MIAFLTALNLFFLLVLCACIFRCSGAVEAGALAVSAFGLLYVIISGFFFWLDAFSFVGVLVTMLVILVPLACCTLRIDRTGIKQLCRSRELQLVEVAIIAVTILLSGKNFELYESGQDQGLYQAEAIELYTGSFEVEHDFEEYHILESEQSKAAYYKMVTEDIGGYYALSDCHYVEFDETERLSDVSGMYHGVQTFPAILALGGRLFGLENMIQIQTVFLACSALLLYFAMCSMGLPMDRRLGVLAIFLLSPLVLWVSKTAFTEMLLTLCISLYLFLLTQGDSPQKRLLLALPLVAFSYVHVSFLLIYPVFMLVDILLYFHSGKREYLWVNVLVSMGLTTGYFMMTRIGPEYFYKNVSRLFWKNIITADNFLCWISLGAVFVSVFSLCLVRLKNPEDIYKKISEYCKLSSVVIPLLLAAVCLHTVILGYFRTPEDGWHDYLCQYYGSGFLGAFTHSALFAFAMATGFFVLPCVLWYGMRRGRGGVVPPFEAAVYILLIYCVLFQSAFIRKEIYYYYYYSRYLVFYIPIICIAFAVVLQHEKKRGLWGVLAGSLICAMIFDVPLLTQNDQTMLEWESLIDLDAVVQDDAAIMIDPNVIRLIGPTLKALTGESIFPVMSDLGGEVEILRAHYKNVYYLSSGFTSVGILLEENGFDQVYHDQYVYQTTGVTEDGHFPLRYPAETRELILYQFGQGRNTAISMSSIGVKNAERSTDFIRSTGAPGLVIYGPYVALTQGDYCFEVPIEIERQQDQSLGDCYIGTVVEGEASILDRMPVEVFLVQDDQGTCLRVPFHLDQFTEKIEFKIDATEGSVFRVYPYRLYYSQSS